MLPAIRSVENRGGTCPGRSGETPKARGKKEFPKPKPGKNPKDRSKGETVKARSD